MYRYFLIDHRGTVALHQYEVFDLNELLTHVAKMRVDI